MFIYNCLHGSYKCKIPKCNVFVFKYLFVVFLILDNVVVLVFVSTDAIVASFEYINMLLVAF